ncbi:hypothetical protein CMI37_06180 [Candidatus Pacearchaeota archaeon]|nr:hypothetical protein [Candidatus Pacearchaeota archaeon]
MAWRIKLRHAVHNAKLRDGKGFGGRLKLLSADSWVRFENKPTEDDPNLIIEEIKKVPTIDFPKADAPAAPVPAPAVKKKSRRKSRKKTTAAKD